MSVWGAPGDLWPSSAQHLKEQQHSVTCGDYVQKDTASLSLRSRLCVSVCDLGTLVVESGANVGALVLYQARGEDSLGLLGFSGVWVSLRALCKTKPTM